MHQISGDFKRIIEAGLQAPSADNIQPWKIAVNGNILEIFNLPDPTDPLGDFHYKVAYLAHGALIENIVIAAHDTGYEPVLALFPDPSSRNLVARITLEKKEPVVQALYPAIFTRATNRKPYFDAPLTDAQKQLIMHAPGFYADAGVKVKIIENPDAKKRLAECLSVNERLVLENQHLHKYLYDHVVWSVQEARQKRHGLFVKTLEMPGPGELIFKLASNFTLAQKLNALGLSKMISGQVAKANAQAAAFIAIYARSDSDQEYIESGRLLERIWLEAAAENLSMHPVSGVTFLHHGLSSGLAGRVSAAHAQLIEDCYNEVVNIFGLASENITFIFRIGKAPQPSALTEKISLEQALL